ncbi:Permease of the drug/metabolite transporter (DMT) superfamily protein [Minicystis rosea]|nr:Permease of the drug/metabolite transporter (DMT) superfamily protein [Minicystis rosea]
MSTKDRLLLPLCLGVLFTVWGSTYLAQRVAVAGMPPLQMAAVRFLVSGALLYAGLRAAGAPAPTAREWKAAAITALPLMVTGMGTAAVAITRVPSGLGALLFASVPLWTALFDRMRGGRLRGLEAMGLALGFAGVSLVASRGALRAEPLGAMLMAGAAASYALGCVATRRARLAAGVMGTTSQMLTGGSMLAVASVAWGEPMARLDAKTLGALAYLVVLGTVVAYSAFGWLLKNARPALATSYAYVNPIIALALGAALGGERFANADYIGLSLVLSAVALVGWAQRSNRVGTQTLEAEARAG